MHRHSSLFVRGQARGAVSVRGWHIGRMGVGGHPSGNPVSFQPFFDDLQRRFENQYALEFTVPVDRKPQVETLRLKVEGLGLQVTAPQQVFVHPGGSE